MCVSTGIVVFLGCALGVVSIALVAVIIRLWIREKTFRQKSGVECKEEKENEDGEEEKNEGGENGPQEGEEESTENNNYELVYTAATDIDEAKGGHATVHSPMQPQPADDANFYEDARKESSSSITSDGYGYFRQSLMKSFVPQRNIPETVVEDVYDMASDVRHDDELVYSNASDLPISQENAGSPLNDFRNNEALYASPHK